MRITLKTLVLLPMLLVLLAPLAVYADEPCPDDPELSAACESEAPPFYVVLNRSFEDLDRPGTGCQPIILENPDCKDCCGEDEACLDAQDYVQETVCPMLAEKVEWISEAQTETVYVMCCDCPGDSEATWRYRVHVLLEDGSCPIDNLNPDCYEGLPPDTGINLPTYVIVGSLALIGVALLAVGVVVHWRGLITT